MPAASSPQPDSRPAAPLGVVAVAFVGAMSALAGGYWDDAWHTERGRDDFFIAPHIAIYAGIATAGAALSLWALLATRHGGLAAVLRHQPLTLALLSVGVTLASGPIDNAWHVAFGRDAVIWSPPHMLGIAGTFGLGAAILAELAGRPEPWARPLTVVAGALVLAAAAFATVEYDTDVPQFGIVFYLPVLGFASSLALVLVRLASDDRWAATMAAAVYTAFIVAVGGFLMLLEFGAPALPLLLAAAVIVDTATVRGWNPASTAAAYTAVLHMAYVPVRNFLGNGVEFDASDVLLGAGLTWVGTLVVFALAAGWRPRLARASTGVSAVVLATLTIAPAAFAHDPGQGEDASAVGLRVTVDGETADLTADLGAADCRSTQPLRVTARRGGKMQRASLRKTGCRLHGAVRLPERGRWFVYAEMSRKGDAVESWLPVIVGSDDRTVSDPQRYAYFPPDPSDGAIKVIAGVVLYGVMLALLYATIALTRASQQRRTARSSQ